MPYLLRPEYGGDFGKRHLGYPLERVLDLTLLALQLKFIRQMLPATAATYGEVLAARLLSDRRRLDKTLYMPLGI